MSATTTLDTQLHGLTLCKRGKVRDVYDLGGGSGAASASGSHDLGDLLVIVATDRISAFDVVLPTGIPRKGAVLTQLSAFWFEMVRERGLTESHFVTADVDEMIAHDARLHPHRAALAGRAMLVKKTHVVPIECVVRGFLVGSGWKEYRETQAVCGVALPAGLQEASELAQPLFTPATKAETGHDINIAESDMARRVGHTLTRQLRAASLAIYTMARAYARTRGIIIADTKFEFGLRDGQLLLVDEVLTPDSSRFWPAQDYKTGCSPVSFDKQFVRDYLEALRWNKQPPGPALPDEVARKTSEKYLQAFAQLTGHPLA